MCNDGYFDKDRFIAAMDRVLGMCANVSIDDDTDTISDDDERSDADEK